MTRLNFSDADHDDFWDHKDALVGELSARLGLDRDEEVVGDAAMFMDWTVNYADGDLSRYSIDDIEEYLLGWCPRKVSSDPVGYLPIVDGAKEWIIHLVLTDQWTGGPVQPLLKRLEGIVPEFLDAMSNPANFGLAKGMFMGPALSGADIDMSDPASLEAAMEAFNALSAEERKALTDSFMSPGGPPDPVDSDPVDLPPTPAPDPQVVAAQAAVAPLIGQLTAVGEYLGSKGIKLTATGNPKLVDAKVLRDLFATDDEWERPSADGSTKPVRSADQLPHLQSILTLAVSAGAIDDDGRAMRAAPGWEELEPLDRCGILFDTATQLGPALRDFGQHRVPFREALDELMSVGVLHLVIPAFVNGEILYEEMLDRAQEIVSGELANLFPKMVESAIFRAIVDQELSDNLDTLQRCGVVERRDVEMVDDWLTGWPTPSGGTVAVLDLGRALLTPVLPTIGYAPHELADLSVCSAADAGRVLDTMFDGDPAQVWADWLPGVDPADKVDQLIAALGDAPDPSQRLALVSILSEAPPDVRRRSESIADGPLGAYAAMVLDGSLFWMRRTDIDDLDEIEAAEVDRAHLATQLTDGRTVSELLSGLGPAASLLPLVDMLWMEMMDDPDMMFETTVELGTANGSSFAEILDDLWRVPVPETAEVLEFLGSEHPDKKLAKAARKALFRYRGAHPSAS
ncbi:MAG: hypothetical protein WBA45_10265 [Microthrixaceae bacterium]